MLKKRLDAALVPDTTNTWVLKKARLSNLDIHVTFKKSTSNSIFFAITQRDF